MQKFTGTSSGSTCTVASVSTIDDVLERTSNAKNISFAGKSSSPVEHHALGPFAHSVKNFVRRAFFVSSMYARNFYIILKSVKIQNYLPIILKHRKLKGLK